MTHRQIVDAIATIDTRLHLYRTLRAVAAGALPSSFDSTVTSYTYAGSIASDIVNVLEASLVGRVDLRIEPADDLADALLSTLYVRHLHPLVRESVRDYIICGWGGIVITPWGPRRLKPESSTFIGRDGYLRKYSMPASDARRRFGNRKALFGKRDDVQLVECLADGYLEVWFGDERLFRKEWDYRPQLLLGDERPAEIDDFRGAPIGIVESARELFLSHYLVGLAIRRKSLRAGLVQVVASELDDPASAENIASRWDAVIVRQGPAIIPVEQMSLSELLAVRQSIEQEIASRTGVTPFARGLSDPRTQTATEVALIQSQGGTRLAYMQSEVRDWLNACVADFRRYLVWLPADEQEAIEIPFNGTVEVFGVGRPYGDVLAGKYVSVNHSGYTDIIQRQQEVQMLLPVLAQAGANIQPLLEELIRLSGRDPKQLLSTEGVSQ